MAKANPQSATEPASASSATVPPATVAEALAQVAAEAAVVFTGSVSTVVADAGGGAVVQFAVERGIRGTASSSIYTAHVSAWSGGTERFFLGERALFLLTAPCAAGYSAPVMGERGIVPLSGDGLVGNLDLRWIAADARRTAITTNTSGPSPLRADLQPLHAMDLAAPPAPVVPPLPMPDVRSIDRDLVLDMLRSENHAASEIQ